MDEINRDIKTYAVYLLRDVPDDLRGEFSVEDMSLRRLTYVYPDAYTEKEFKWAADWMRRHGLRPDHEPSYRDLVQV